MVKGDVPFFFFFLLFYRSLRFSWWMDLNLPGAVVRALPQIRGKRERHLARAPIGQDGTVDWQEVLVQELEHGVPVQLLDDGDDGTLRDEFPADLYCFRLFFR